MAISASATPALTMSYTVTDTQTDRTISESATAGFSTLTFANGTGLSQVDMGVTITGILPAGGSTVFNLTGLPKTVFGKTIDVNFSQWYAATFPPTRPGNRIRGVLIRNTWEHPSGTPPASFEISEYPYLTVMATGSNGCTPLFNGGTGDYKIMPDSAWMFIDSIGVQILDGPSATNELGLIDSGSGVPYELSIVGTTGDWRGPS